MIFKNNNRPKGFTAYLVEAMEANGYCVHQRGTKDSPMYELPDAHLFAYDLLKALEESTKENELLKNRLERLNESKKAAILSVSETIKAIVEI